MPDNLTSLSLTECIGKWVHSFSLDWVKPRRTNSMDERLEAEVSIVFWHSFTQALRKSATYQKREQKETK
jgi:hypothetical protein